MTTIHKELSEDVRVLIEYVFDGVSPHVARSAARRVEKWLESQETEVLL